MKAGHILLADNDPDFLDTRAEFLENASYRVLKAYTLDQARQLLAKGRVCLAILDIRMENDDDEKDVSGLNLARDLVFLPIPKIMLTNYPSYQHVREALGPPLDGMPPAVDYLSKKEGPEAMLRAVEQALERHVRINWGLQIRWGERERLSFPHLVTLIELRLETTHLPERAGELEDLFRKLFYEQRQITIGRLFTRSERRVILEVLAYGDAGLEGQFVVSCGRRHRVREEDDRYERFVPKGIAVGSTGKVKTEETVHFAATTYRLNGGDLEEITNFGEFYAGNSTEEVMAALENLFSTTLAPWHKTGRYHEKDKRLSKLYLDWLGLGEDALSQAELECQVEAICREVLASGLARLDHSPHKVTLHLPDGSPVSYPNPGRYLQETWNALKQPVQCGVTHGRVDADTVLVDRQGHTWLVDFAQAGRGPLLRDFVSLEIAVKVDLLDTSDLLMRYELERRLLSAGRLDEAICAEDFPPELKKALKGTERIRLSAATVVGHDPDSYLAGLLFSAIGRLAGYDPEVRHTRRELVSYAHSLLMAGMLCEQWAGSVQSPEQLPMQARNSLWIDDENRVVWVEGRQVGLTPQDYRLLAFLYENAGQLCQRQAIVEDALKDKYEEAIVEESRLNSAVRRLRQKIEPDPDRPKYIVTVRGHGYKLIL